MFSPARLLNLIGLERSQKKEKPIRFSVDPSGDRAKT